MRLPCGKEVGEEPCDKLNDYCLAMMMASFSLGKPLM